MFSLPTLVGLVLPALGTPPTQVAPCPRASRVQRLADMSEHLEVSVEGWVAGDLPSFEAGGHHADEALRCMSEPLTKAESGGYHLLQSIRAIRREDPEQARLSLKAAVRADANGKLLRSLVDHPQMGPMIEEVQDFVAHDEAGGDSARELPPSAVGTLWVDGRTPGHARRSEALPRKVYRVDEPFVLQRRSIIGSVRQTSYVVPNDVPGERPPLPHYPRLRTRLAIVAGSSAALAGGMALWRAGEAKGMEAARADYQQARRSGDAATQASAADDLSRAYGEGAFLGGHASSHNFATWMLLGSGAVSIGASSFYLATWF